ncbi:MAG TPA: hypothetical protein VI756_02575, partial [Blastocatellia bacterium]
ILAVAEGCHFCSESADFYKRIAKAVAGSETHLVVVLPQEVSEGRRYLSGLGVDVADVRKASLDSLGVAGTPTLILVDNSGLVKKVWVGKLSPEGEADVLNSLHQKTALDCTSCSETSAPRRFRIRRFTTHAGILAVDS